MSVRSGRIFVPIQIFAVDSSPPICQKSTFILLIDLRAKNLIFLEIALTENHFF